MSEHVDDDELKQLIKSGAKIVSRKPPEKVAPSEPSDLQKIIAAIHSLDRTLSAIADRPAPEVNVAAPRVVVEPKISMPDQKPAWRKVRVKVEERDKTVDQRIKSFILEVIE